MKSPNVMLIAGVVALVVGISPCIGLHSFSPLRVISGALTDAEWQTLILLRAPRVVLGFIAGAVLGVSGAAFQGIFRNSLASPFTLGISSAAAFGAALAITLGVDIPWFPATTAFSLCGAGVGIAFILALTHRASLSASSTVLLAGVMLSFLFSSLILLLQYIADVGEVFRMTSWMLGSIVIVGWQPIVILLPFVAIGMFVVLRARSAINLLSLGDDLALARGIDVVRVRRQLLGGVSVMIGAVVSVCGPIGFVGVIVPWCARMFIGYDNRIVVPISALLGGALVVVGDTIGRVVIAPAEIPVGVLTAMIGAPLFIWALSRGAGAHGG